MNLGKFSFLCHSYLIFLENGTLHALYPSHPIYKYANFFLVTYKYRVLSFMFYCSVILNGIDSLFYTKDIQYMLLPSCRTRHTFIVNSGFLKSCS